MAGLNVDCPKCQATLALGAAAVPGKKIRCPKCESVFVVPEAAEPERVERPMKRKRPLQRKSRGMATGVLVSLVGAGLFVVAGAAVAGVMIWKSRGAGTTQVVKDVVPPSGVGREIGQLVTEISGEDIQGKPFKLSDYRGKVVVLDFWGHW